MDNEIVVFFNFKQDIFYSFCRTLQNQIKTLQMTIEALNQQYGIKDVAHFSQESANGLVFLTINNSLASARIALYGAQILSYKPIEQPDVLWVSDQSHFKEGKAIRGGIPVCFPWFGPHATDRTMPQHGFARTSNWQVQAVKQLTDGATAIQLMLEQSDETLKLWPFPFRAVINFVVGVTLQVTFRVTNTGTTSFQYSDALHTYFNISDIAAIELDGFDNSPYYEAFGDQLFQQTDTSLHPDIENNRRYIQHSGEAIITDPGYNRKIRVGKTGSKVTVVWNPGPITSKNFTDMSAGGYKNFICIEPANAYAGIDMVDVAPGEDFSISTTIKID